MTNDRDIRKKIAAELYAALERLGTAAELLDVVRSWRDTLDDGEVLARLREWSAGRPTLHRAH